MQPALGSSYLNALVGGKKHVVSVDSFLISRNYPLLSMHAESFLCVFVWVFVVVICCLSVLLACSITTCTVPVLKLVSLSEKHLKRAQVQERSLVFHPAIDVISSWNVCSQEIFTANVLPANK